VTARNLLEVFKLWLYLKIFAAGTGALTYRTVALPRALVKTLHATLMVLRQEIKFFLLFN
jgi:hypothetical protein